MKAARNLGFDPYGVEISEQAVEYAKKEMFLPNIFAGTIEEVNFQEKFFDIVYSWHVIEHVLDLKTYLEKISLVLKDNGLVVIGTENNTDLFYTLKRWSKIISGKVPDLLTASEHTYGFTAEMLRKIFEANNFEVSELKVYEDNARNSFLGQGNRGNIGVRLIKKIILRALYLISKIFPTGKKIRLVARKKRLIRE